MEPNYHNLQLVLLNKHVSEQSLNISDVVAFKCEELNEVLVKRIVAIPGQIAVIEEGTLFVNSVPTSLYDEKAFQYSGLLENGCTLQNGEFIVIGDNIAESKDSRYSEIGIVKMDSIIGKVIF